MHLRLPDLPDAATRAALEAQDLLIKGDRASVWNNSEHPRTGVLPNPGWFAPKDSLPERAPPVRSAQRGRGERESEGILDPIGSARQAVWDARIARLREIDPANANLTYFANPNSPPSQQALDRLDAAIEAASIKRVTDKVMPNGAPIGRQGRGADVRELPGGLDAAKQLFDYLRVGGRVVEAPSLEGILIRLPGNAGHITFRPISRSGSPALDINVPGVPFDKIHFP